jgi:hypothetical protein
VRDDVCGPIDLRHQRAKRLLDQLLERLHGATAKAGKISHWDVEPPVCSCVVPQAEANHYA